MSEQTIIRMTTAEYFERAETNQFEELLNGELIMSPPPLLNHQRVVAHFYKLIDKLIPDGEVFFAPLALRLDQWNVPEPDVVWVAAQSRCKLVREGLDGPPDLIVEVLSPSTAKRDRGDKFDLYEKHGVREYWLADYEGQYVEVYVLKDGAFQRQGVYGAEDHFESAVLGGKDIDLQQIFAEKA